MNEKQMNGNARLTPSPPTGRDEEVLVRDLAAEILSEHKELEAVIRELEHKLEEGGPAGARMTWFRNLHDELTRFRTHLQRHFVLEEESGFMDEMVNQMPHAASKVGMLCKEHGSILAAIDELINATDRDAARFAELCRRIHHAISVVKRHENDEHLLIQTVYSQDLGAAD